ncbi:hypothetical protein [Neoroseomonas soli]|uniref:Uncharacterized protein n=1 Tax=Neoroseomonas soli TaxID=1081025 RepID=A0A9X9WU45_9PROT|nr:hypothetical protein [Neoroseomonas soli]MBR0670674.1 hypothetical protein [Neoroseomonas soli]
MYIPYTHHVAPAEMAHVTAAFRHGLMFGVLRWVLTAAFAVAVIGLVVARLLA